MIIVSQAKLLPMAEPVDFFIQSPVRGSVKVETVDRITPVYSVRICIQNC